MTKAQRIMIACEVERNGSVCKSGVEVAKYDGSKKGVQVGVWNTMNMGDFAAAVKNIDES